MAKFNLSKNEDQEFEAVAVPVISAQEFNSRAEARREAQLNFNMKQREFKAMLSIVRTATIWNHGSEYSGTAANWLYNVYVNFSELAKVHELEAQLQETKAKIFSELFK